MLGWRHANYLLAAGAVVLASLAISSVSNGAERRTGFILTSDTFKDGGEMPASTWNGHGCGGNISPQLAWENSAPGTKSYVLSFYTVEGGPSGQYDLNMLVYGIPVSVTSFAEGELDQPSTTGKFVTGKGNRPNRPIGFEGTYGGGCTPIGASPHHYIFKLTATDLDPKALPPNLSLSEVEYEIKGHAPDTIALTGKITRPVPTPPPPFVRSGFTLTSTAFKDNEIMPARTNGCGTNENLSPQLSWSNVPVAADMLNPNLVKGAKTNFGPTVKSFAILEETVEGGQGVSDVNMLIYGIPADVRSLAEGELNKPSTTGKFIVGRPGPPMRGRDGYWRGPCTPAGTAPHHFIIKIIATDLDPKDLQPGLSKTDFLAKLKYDPDTTSIIGLNSNP